MDTTLTDADRPQEGDLVYHPILSRMFEVSFVDHDDPFYQLDNNPIYKLRCRQYEYSHEEIDTGITAIDAITKTKVNKRFANSIQTFSTGSA